MPDKALAPIVQKEVIYYKDVITAVPVAIEQEQIYVPVRPICDYLGLDWSAQYRRINRDPVLSDVMQGVAMAFVRQCDALFVTSHK